MRTDIKITGTVIAGFFILLLGIGVGAAVSNDTVTTTNDTIPKPAVTITATTTTTVTPAPAKVTAPPATVTKTTTVTPEAVDSFSDGIYLVGTDIKAGTYKTPGPVSSDILDSCYVERAKNDSGEFGSVISNDNLTGPGRVTVHKGEIFKVSGGCTWSRA